MPATQIDFDLAFECLTGHSPFPWQRRLYEAFLRGEFPPCSLPTGLGKTSVIAVWLLALASQAAGVESSHPVPRRLAYVVNRRTIVDQATDVAMRLRENVDKDGRLQSIRHRLQSLRGGGDDVPLAISTLRGQFADNGEWSADPARPAIIVGTVDMIGSRLLFSGYGRGFKHRPLHAGFLGQDTLLVHDEAHLEPAFQHLLDTIGNEQRKGRRKDFRPMRVMPMTATPRILDGAQPFELTEADLGHAVIKQRYEATKTIMLHGLEDEKQSAEVIAALALKRAESDPGRAILVFVRRVEDVKRVVRALDKAKMATSKVAQLTGTLRGLERDNLVKTPVFQRFLPASSRDPLGTPEPGTVILVCTSAGEVGVDFSADHLVCDLTTFDSMVQRFGRVNRYGDREAKIDIAHPEEYRDTSANIEYEARRKKTLVLLRGLQGDGSPRAIAEISLQQRMDAFSPAPRILVATDILFDAWALTTVRDTMPGRPPVADWLHGVAEWEAPETRVAWRDEVQWITGALAVEHGAKDLLELYPLKPHELLMDRSRRVLDELKKMAQRLERASDDQGNGGEVPVWIEDDRGLEVTTLQQIVSRDEDRIANRTVILPPFAGGLAGGMLDGECPWANDVGDQWLNGDGKPLRRRVWDNEAVPPGMRPVCVAIDVRPDADQDDAGSIDRAEESIESSLLPVATKSHQPPGRLWKWYALPRSSDDDGSQAAVRAVELRVHTADVEHNVLRIVSALGLALTVEGKALVLAARWHDMGKVRGVWQRSIWNNEYPHRVLAKSGHRRLPRELSPYRHEFGSLLDVLSPRMKSEWDCLGGHERDLVLHFIAVHHGRARPYFPGEEAFDPENANARAYEIACDVPHRFSRLQRRYGRWGLAYLESILRAADAAASARPSVVAAEEADETIASAVSGGVP